MRLPFTKMNGAGNDFVLLDATRCVLPPLEPFARRLCDRHFGVGADGLADGAVQAGVGCGRALLHRRDGDAGVGEHDAGGALTLGRVEAGHEAQLVEAAPALGECYF